MKATIQTAPTAEPVTLIEAFQQLRLLVPDEAPAAHPDAPYIETLITVARRYAESITGRALMTQTWDYWLDRFPAGDAIPLPFPPLQSLTSLTYTDADADAATLTEGTEITVDTDSEPGRIVLDYDQTWPTDMLHPNNPVAIRFVAGYTSAALVPAEIKHAIKIMITHWYEQRAMVTYASINNVPSSVDALLASYRVRSF